MSDQQRWANSGLAQTKKFGLAKNQTNFFWSGIWSGGLAFGLAVWSNRNRTKSVLNGMFAFFLGGIPIFMIHNG